MFTTHSHGDHIGALFAFCDLINWYYKDMNIDVFMTERSAADAISNLVSSASRKLDTERIRMRIAEAGEVYSDENVKVTYIPTKHIEMLGRPSYAILIEGEGKRVLFSGDLSQKLSLGDFPTEAYGELDLFVLELAHFGLCELDGILPNIGAMHLAFSHVSPIAKYEDIEAIKGKYPFEILTPSDMDEITV